MGVGMMDESLSDVIARLQERLRPHAVSPVTATRKATDSGTQRANAANSGEHYPPANTLSGRKRGGRYPNTYRPRAKDFAGMDPATTRANALAVKPSNGIPIERPAYGGGRPSSKAVETARAIGRDNSYRQWLSARGNLERDAGDLLPDGSHYPSELTDRGNLGPSPRY